MKCIGPARWLPRERRSAPTGNRRQCSGEGLGSPLAAQRMNLGGNGDWLKSRSSEACPGSRGLLRVAHAIRPLLAILVTAPLRQSGARPGMEDPQPQGFLGEMSQTVPKQRERRAEVGERTGRRTRKRSPQHQDQDNSDLRSSSSHGLKS
jgi:hypothetical protein